MWLVYVLTIFQLGFSAFFEPAKTAAIPSIVSDRELLPADGVDLPAGFRIPQVIARIGHRRRRDPARRAAKIQHPVIAAMRPEVDKFFEQVMVMAENEAVRKNRLALLAELLREFTTIADFSEVGGETRS